MQAPQAPEEKTPVAKLYPLLVQERNRLKDLTGRGGSKSKQLDAFIKEFEQSEYEGKEWTLKALLNHRMEVPATHTLNFFCGDFYSGTRMLSLRDIINRQRGCWRFTSNETDTLKNLQEGLGKNIVDKAMAAPSMIQ